MSELKVNLKKKDEALEDVIMERLGIGESGRERIRHMLNYNMMTVSQVMHLTKMTRSTITNKLRPQFDADGNLYTELDFAHPFRDLEGNGPKMIVRNEKLDKLLLQGRRRRLRVPQTQEVE